MKHRSPRHSITRSNLDLSTNSHHYYRSRSSSSNYHFIVSLLALPKLLLAYPLDALLKHISNNVLNDPQNPDHPNPNHNNAHSNVSTQSHYQPLTPQQYWVYLAISASLVLLGGVFAGLTLGLMGQDEVYLKVISTSGEPSEQKNAKKVLKLIDRGKHWVLVTLLLANVITNETLPIVLDRILGGGWPAVVSSTASIVIFGEVIPQSLCVRYGLQIGSFFTPFVLFLMYCLYPIAYPIAILLDRILGEDHGTIYKKSGLKTLVTLHRTMGVERLNDDEVTIISAVLDLKEKKVCEIMTPIENVYTMASDRILNEKTVEEIFNSGFSRIPIHMPNEPCNFIGMLLVRVLISYDPEDALPVSSFPLATLPETPPSTSCLNILNYFQEGKSHMVVVSEQPGDSVGALGVLTLEDVIEELIGEEIVDESDVFVDIHKAIKRAQPGPLSKRHLTQYLHQLYTTSSRNSTDRTIANGTHTNNHSHTHTHTHGHGHTRGGINGNLGSGDDTVQFKPSNLASDPLETKKTFVTIKKQPQSTKKTQFSFLDNEIDTSNLNGSGDLVFTNSNTSPFPNPNDSSSSPLARAMSPNYGSSESRNSYPDSKSVPHFRKFVVPSSSERNSLDLTECIEPSINTDLNTAKSKSSISAALTSGVAASTTKSTTPATTATSRTAATTLATTTSSPSNSTEDFRTISSELHGYRATSGIIESVVTHQGVSKIIIQAAQDEDDTKYEKDRSSSRSSNSHSNSTHSGCNESEALLGRYC